MIAVGNAMRNIKKPGQRPGFLNLMKKFSLLRQRLQTMNNGEIRGKRRQFAFHGLRDAGGIEGRILS